MRRPRGERQRALPVCTRRRFRHDSQAHRVQPGDRDATYRASCGSRPQRRRPSEIQGRDRRRARRGAQASDPGAEPIAGRGVHARVWAPTHDRVTLVIEAPGRAPRDRPRTGPDGYHAAWSRHGPARATGSGSTATTGSRPTRLALPAGGPARAVAGGRSGALRWTDAAGGRRARGPGASTRCTSARSPPRAPGRRPRAQLARARRARRHRHRGDAGRRVPRRASAGATTASTCSRRRTSTARPTTSARFVDRAHALGLGVILDVVYNHLGPRRELPLRVLAELLQRDRYANEWGDAINFDGDGRGPVREFFVAQRRLLDRRVPPRRPAPRRDAGDPRRLAATTSSPTIVARARARRRGTRPIVHRRRERAAGRRRCVRPPRRAGTGSTRCGTTTSTTRACRR